MDNQQYRGWLVSTSLWKRSLAVFGHYLIIALPLGIILTLIFGGF